MKGKNAAIKMSRFRWSKVIEHITSCLLILFCCLITFSIINVKAMPNSTREWKEYAQNDSGDTHYFDTKSITRNEDGIVDVWERFVLAKPQIKGTKTMEMHFQYDISNYKFRLGTMNVYRGDGYTLASEASYKAFGEWQPIPTGSIAEEALRYYIQYIDKNMPTRLKNEMHGFRKYKLGMSLQECLEVNKDDEIKLDTWMNGVYKKSNSAILPYTARLKNKQVGQDYIKNNLGLNFLDNKLQEIIFFIDQTGSTKERLERLNRIKDSLVSLYGKETGFFKGDNNHPFLLYTWHGKKVEIELRMMDFKVENKNERSSVLSVDMKYLPLEKRFLEGFEKTKNAELQRGW